MTQATDIADLKNLPVAERLKVIEDLWDSIEAEGTQALPLLDWQQDEIDQRLEALDAGISTGAPWSEVRRRITGQT